MQIFNESFQIALGVDTDYGDSRGTIFYWSYYATITGVFNDSYQRGGNPWALLGPVKAKDGITEESTSAIQITGEVFKVSRDTATQLTRSTYDPIWLNATYPANNPREAAKVVVEFYAKKRAELIEWSSIIDSNGRLPPLQLKNISPRNLLAGGPRVHGLAANYGSTILSPDSTSRGNTAVEVQRRHLLGIPNGK